MGYSVTQCVQLTTQPRGGFLSPKDFKRKSFSNIANLFPESHENVSPAIVGLAVDYLTRLKANGNVRQAFEISILGAQNLEKFSFFTAACYDDYRDLLKIIKPDLSDESIIAACKMVGFDVCFRVHPSYFKPVQTPSAETIENIRRMVSDTYNLMRSFKKAIVGTVTFEGGYTSTVSSGDGDFIVGNTLFDIKVSHREATAKHTLQLLMYFIMYRHSKFWKKRQINKIGIINPRLGFCITKEISEIPVEVLQTIERTILKYNEEDWVF